MKKLVFLLLIYPCFLIASEGLDFSKFQEEDSNRTMKRKQKDESIEEYLNIENRARAERRNDLTNAKMFIEEASTGHATSDKETQETRNEATKNIIAKRLAEDFEIRAQRFNVFKTKYPDFAKNDAWSNLLELGDINSFLSKNYTQRKNLLTKLKDILRDPRLTENIDGNALQDLLKLTLFHNMKNEPIDEELKTAIINNKNNIQENVAEALKNVFSDYVARLEGFNEALHNLPQIDTLNMLEKIENASNQASITLGFAALFTMLAGPAHLAVMGVTITVEKFAIGAKVAFATGHIAGAKADDLKVEIQNAITEQIEAVTNTALPKASIFKNMGDSISKRFNKWLSNDTGLKGKAYRWLQEVGKNASDKISKTSDWAKNSTDVGAYALRRTGAGVKSVGKGIASGISAVAKGIAWGAKTAYKSGHYAYHRTYTYGDLNDQQARIAYEKQKAKDKRDEYNKSLKKFLPLNINLDEGEEVKDNSDAYSTTAETRSNQDEDNDNSDTASTTANYEDSNPDENDYQTDNDEPEDFDETEYGSDKQ